MLLCHYFVTPIQAINRLQRLNLTVSYKSVVRLLDKVGARFDEKTKKWRDDLLDVLKSCDTAVSTCTVTEVPNDKSWLSAIISSIHHYINSSLHRPSLHQYVNTAIGFLVQKPFYEQTKNYWKFIPYSLSFLLITPIGVTSNWSEIPITPVWAQWWWWWWWWILIW